MKYDNVLKGFLPPSPFEHDKVKYGKVVIDPECRQHTSIEVYRERRRAEAKASAGILMFTKYGQTSISA